VYEATTAGSCATRSDQPRQVRKEATVRQCSRVPRAHLVRAVCIETAWRMTADDGCTTHSTRLPTGRLAHGLRPNACESNVLSERSKSKDFRVRLAAFSGMLVGFGRLRESLSQLTSASQMSSDERSVLSRHCARPATCGDQRSRNEWPPPRQRSATVGTPEWVRLPPPT